MAIDDSIQYSKQCMLNISTSYHSGERVTSLCKKIIQYAIKVPKIASNGRTIAFILYSISHIWINYGNSLFNHFSRCFNHGKTHQFLSHFLEGAEGDLCIGHRLAPQLLETHDIEGTKNRNWICWYWLTHMCMCVYIYIYILVCIFFRYYDVYKHILVLCN